MAIVQISRITNRKGLTENLPQLAGAELGWATDSRRLFVGNGTLSDGAPVIGNTEILTEFSDITVLSDYTYADIAVGYEAQTGPSAATPVIRSLQAKLDDMASVRDFGAVGNGIADDTAAINRALFELYCRESNSQIRRSLFFPAGTYRVSDSILIPAYAKLVGEGRDSSIIFLGEPADISTLTPCVARFADSRQQIGVNIGTNSATPPTNIEISSMAFKTSQLTDVFLIDAGERSSFQNVGFVGPLSTVNSGAIDIACVSYPTVAGFVTNNIVFDSCWFTNSTHGHNAEQPVTGVTITNGGFDTLHRGVFIRSSAGGFRIVHNTFDRVFNEGLLINSSLNASAYNIFYNVGNGINASNPLTSIVKFGNNNNVSVGDMFERSDGNNNIEPRVEFVGNSATTGGTGLQLGRAAYTAGQSVTLLDAQASPQPIFSINTVDIQSIVINYQVVRADFIRRGTFTVSATLPAPVAETESFYSDEFTVPPGLDMGVTLSATQVGDQLTIKYTTIDVSFDASFKYNITYMA